MNQPIGASARGRGRPLSHCDLVALLDYEPLTGTFRWRVDRAPMTKAGDIAGSLDACARGGPYWRLYIKGKRYAAHRVAWFYVRGQWPDAEIDHRNTDGLDNRFDNLREATRNENAQNLRRARKDSTSGLIGAMKAPGGRWKSDIRFGGRRLYLGEFASAQEAHAAYIAAKRQLHTGCTL